MIELLPISETFAETLFPIIHRTKVTDTLIWDGPESIEEYKSSLRIREDKMRAGSLHDFVIASDGQPIGAIGLSAEPSAIGDIGLWIGVQFHGRGYGTEAVRLIVELGFGKLDLHRLEAKVFVGNAASRRIFEKNGFQLEQTLHQAVRKRGKLLDEWLLGLAREDFKPRT